MINDILPYIFIGIVIFGFISALRGKGNKADKGNRNQNNNANNNNNNNS